MNQPPDKIPLSEILDENRTRQDYGDVAEFGLQLKEETLIQPIILKQRSDGVFTMLAGSRRRAALISAGFVYVYHGRSCVPNEPGYLLSHEHTESKRKELELIENVRRKQMTWQERCVGIKEAHDLKFKEAVLEGSSWTQRATAEMLGIKGVSNVNYALRVAELIKSGDKEIIDSDNLSDAWKKLIGREERALLAELASRSAAANGNFNSISLPSAFSEFGKQIAPAIAQESECPINEPSEEDAKDILVSENILRLRERSHQAGYLSLSKDEAKELYLSNSLNPIEQFDEYYAWKIESCSKKEQHKNTIYLSKMLYCCDCIELMNHPDCKEKFDAIITDIPYGIDMDMLNQGNDGHAFQNIETVLAEHTVDGNEELFKRFFPAAYHCLKDNTFLITWCDLWNFKQMANLAISAGFTVQRWPFMWIKSHPCMNQSANSNFTKTFESALVCRKGTATLCKTNIPSHIIAAHDDFKKSMAHPFVKPYAIWDALIQAVTLEGHHILEPFAGHGSGVISILKSKRYVTACELNVAHFNSLIENIKSHYNQTSSNLIFA